MTAIAVIGGTGPQGRGLGYRFARGGYDVVLGSRSEERALEAAAGLNERISGPGSLLGAVNSKAVEAAGLVVLAVPFEGHGELVSDLAPMLAGKVVVSCVNPLGFDQQGPFGLDLQGSSAAEHAQEVLPETSVVGAFHHLSAVSLLGEAGVLDHEDVLVCGDDDGAKRQVIELAATITGRPGIDAGALRMARQLEPLTSVLISINKRYKVRSGISISGLDR